MDNFEIKSRDFIENKYLTIHDFHNNRALVRNRDGLYGYLDDVTYNEAIPCQYYQAYDFNDDLALVADENGNRFFIDTNGTKILDCSNYRTSSKQFSDDLLLVLGSNGYGFIDKNKNDTIKCRFALADDFHEGMALVTIDADDYDARVFINKNGNIELYEGEDYYFRHNSSYFNNGIAPVYDRLRKSLYGYITKNGKVLTENLDKLKDLHSLKPKYQVVKEDIKEKFISYCSEITVFDKTFNLKGKTKEELKNKKEELYLTIHEMMVVELQKLTLQTEEEPQKCLK